MGWFNEPQRELMRTELASDVKLVVELGAWLGLSTRFIADQALQARVITIDHWQGSAEHRRDPVCAAMLPTLFEAFIAMNWEYRERITPLRMTTGEGLRMIAAGGLKPDVISIDADHTYDAVSADLSLSHELFPHARLIGDDYDDPDVCRAVNEFAERHGLTVQPVGTGWRAWRLVSPHVSSAKSSSGWGLVSIIIVTHNQCGYTKECIDSIRLRTDEPYELIFVDNGSTDRTVEYLRGITRPFTPSSTDASSEPCGLLAARLIENSDNRGFPAAVNQGLNIARGDYIVLLNNDTVVPTGWLPRILEVFDEDRRIGLVGPCSNNVSGPQCVPVAYQEMASLDGFAWDWGKQHRGAIEDTDRLIGFCLVIKRAVIDQIGLLDERFGIGCFEDDDLCLRALQAGWRAVIARAAFVHHYGNRTFAGSGVDLGNVLDVNRQKFLEKWAQEIEPRNAGAPAPQSEGVAGDGRLQAASVECPGSPYYKPSPASEGGPADLRCPEASQTTEPTGTRPVPTSGPGFNPRGIQVSRRSVYGQSGPNNGTHRKPRLDALGAGSENFTTTNHSELRDAVRNIELLLVSLSPPLLVLLPSREFRTGNTTAA